MKRFELLNARLGLRTFLSTGRQGFKPVHAIALKTRVYHRQQQKPPKAKLQRVPATPADTAVLSTAPAARSTDVRLLPTDR